MTSTATLTDHDLEIIKAALWPVWFDLQSRGEHTAADFIGATGTRAARRRPR